MGSRLADDPAGHEARPLGRRVGHDLVDADLPDRLGDEGDEREDEPGEHEVDDDAGDQDAQARAQPLVDEGARVERLALLALEADEAADGQPVERVDGLLAAMQDERPRREADAELVDA